MTAIEGVASEHPEARKSAAPRKADSFAVQAALQAETTRLLYRTPTVMLVNLLNGSIFAAVLWKEFPAWVILLWLAALYAVVGLRLLNFRSFRRRPLERRDDERWAKRYAIGALATGALWGVAGGASILGTEPYGIVFAAFVIAGMTAGAIAQHAVYLPALFGFMLPAVIPIAAALLAQGTVISLAMGTMTAIFAGALAILGLDLHRSLVQNFRLHAEFKSLTGNLEQEIALRKSAEVELAHLARHDVLTGLPNRAAFFERLKLEVGRGKRGETRFAVHYIDLDHFKEVNDSFGHQVGDRLLAQIAAQLMQSVREVDLVARLGGDEFAILQDGVQHRASAETLATKLLDRLSGTFVIDGNNVRISPSIGIALFHPDITSADMILEQADMAMYRAKAAGRRCFRWHAAGPAPVQQAERR